jgi:MFS family permease
MHHPPGPPERADAGPAQGRAFGALAHRDFRLYWIGNIISNVGGWMQNVAQAWLLYQLTENVFLVGLNGLFHSIPFIFMCLYAGTVVDRVDRKRLLFIVETASTLIVLTMGTLVITGHVQVWHIYASSVFYSLMGAFESPTRQALIPHLVPRRDLMTAVSLNSIVRKGAQIVGPALGGIFVAAFDVGGAYFIHGGARFILLGCLLAMRATNPVEVRTHPNALRAIAEGFRYVRSEPLLLALLVMETGMSVFGSYHAMMVVFARDVFHTGPQGLGVLQSAAGAGSLVGSFALASVGDVKHKGRLLIASGVTLGVALICFAYSPWFLLAMVFLAIAGGSDIMFGATRTTIMQMRTRPDMLGRVMSLSGISMRGFGNFGNFQTGTLASFIGVQGAIAAGALLCIAFTIGAGIKVPLVRNFTETGHPPEPVPAPRDGALAAEPAPAS